MPRPLSKQAKAELIAKTRASNAIAKPQTYACNCIGPQNGDPACPCAMPAYREREAGKRALANQAELLGFVKNYIAAWEAGTGTVYLIDDARALIAKATTSAPGALEGARSPAIQLQQHDGELS